MSSFTTSMIVFATVLAGALLGMALRPALPPHHLSDESKDIVRVATGLVGTMAALVLGLLVASAKGSFDAQSNELIQLSANVVYLDRVLAHYGPEAQPARDQLRRTLLRLSERAWPKDGSVAAGLEPISGNESIYETIQQLSPKDDAHRTLQSDALSIANGLLQTHWLMYEQNTSPIPVTVLVVLVLWLTVIFVSFGLFAPRNATVFTSLFVGALSVSSAVLLILEMYRPYSGLIRIPSAPLLTALSHLGR
jgi:hypothetical protein